MNTVKLIDTTLRDGSHAIHHQYTEEDYRNICRGLEKSGVYAVEVGHGAGIGGSILQFGFAKTSDEKILKAASSELNNSKLGVLLVPGIGTMEDLKKAHSYGAQLVRVAVHCTETDVGEQHMKLAKEIGMETFAFFMMSHMIDPEELAEQTHLAESYGIDGIYLADSAGAMVPSDIRARIEAVREAVDIPVGFHAHNNMGLAIGNSVAAAESGAEFLDGTLQGMGAGCGNAPMEVLSAVLEKANFETGADFYSLMETGEQFIRPLLKHSLEVTNESLILGYTGIYSSFYLHTLEVAKDYGLNPRDIFVELGRRKVVGGQEDLIIEIANEMTP